MVTIEKFYVIGIAVKTQNITGKAETDIPLLWKTFMQEDSIAKIPNKVNKDIYCVYTNFEGDYTMPYTTVLGCKTNSLDTIPEGMTGITIDKNTYQPFIAKGKVFEGAVANEWLTIWQSGMNRTYLADFEVYREGIDYNNAEVTIFVGVNIQK